LFVSNVVRSAGWVNTSYLNQRFPGLFYGVGVEESLLEYTLITHTNGSGSGTVEVSPGGPYHYNDVVTLWANASVGSMFTGWYGNLSGTTSPETLTITGDMDVTAEFTLLEYNHEIPIYEKWNMISVPFNQSYSKTSITVEYLGVNYTWTDAVSAGILLDFLYSWDRSTQSYVNPGSFEPGESYRLYANHDCSLWISGESNTDDYITDLLVNWNLMGLPYDEPVDKANLSVYYSGSLYSWQDAVTAGIVVGFIYEWNPVSQSYVTVDVVSPDLGYWIYSYQNCILNKGEI